MAAMKSFAPLSVWFQPLGGLKIKLSHEEIEEVSNAGSPVAALTGLIPGVGPIIAAAIAVHLWLIKRVDKKHGFKGVVIFVGPGAGGVITRAPDTW